MAVDAVRLNVVWHLHASQPQPAELRQLAPILVFAKADKLARFVDRFDRQAQACSSLTSTRNEGGNARLFDRLALDDAS